MKEFSKARRIASWIIVGLITALLLFSGIGKIMASGDPEAEMYQNFARWGLEGKLLLIAAGEILAALLFVIPRTSSLGTLLLTAHFGGAIATHMEHGESYGFVVILLLLVWIATFLRNPEMFGSFKEGLK